MPPQLKGKGSKRSFEASRRMSWRETSLNGSTVILSLVKEAATFSPFSELKRAASVALFLLKTIQAVRENKEAYERLGDDSGGLIVVIWRSYRNSRVPDEWLSAEMREILQELTHTLENICSFVEGKLSRSKAIRVLFSKADAVKIDEYREHLGYAMQKFELQSHMNINEVLLQLVRKNDQLSEQIQHRSEDVLHRKEEDDILLVKRALEISAREARDREEAYKIHAEELKAEKEISEFERLKQVEIDHQTRDELWQSNDLKKIEKETKEREVELERLRAASSALRASRLKKAQEEEIAQLKRQLAGDDDSRRSTTVQAPSTKKKSSRRQVEVEEEEDWEGSVVIEEATSEEEEEVRQPVRVRSKVKKNPSKSPKKRPVSADNSMDDDEEDLQSLRSSKSKIGTARRKLSNASLRADQTDDESTDEEYYEPRLPRKSSKVNRKPQRSSASSLHDMDDLMAQFQRFSPLGMGSPHGSGSRSRPASPMYFPSYGSYFPPGMGTYGYDLGAPGTIVNSGVGNVTNTTISNVGNNNSVRKIYRLRIDRVLTDTPVTRSQRRAAGN